MNRPNYDTPKYGVFLGRFSPPHLMHCYTIDHIMEDDITPLIIIGSAQESRTEKNPYTVDERKDMLRLMYPDIEITQLDDSLCWDAWYDSLRMLLAKYGTFSDDITIYTHNKPQDLTDFTFRGKLYENEWYSKVYEVMGLNVKNVPFSGKEVHASQIRNDIEANKNYLHHKVYNYLRKHHEQRNTKQST